MKRQVAMLGAAVLLAGCQAQNPYALFGPNRVPTPGMQAPAPYYPANASAAPATNANSAIGGRTSVSVATPAPGTSSMTMTDAGDKEPIRIVENPAPAARTATSGATRSAGTPADASPSNGAPPATSGKSSRIFRSDPSVAPAAFESAATPGQWKSR